jgi:hypothetical protein
MDTCPTVLVTLAPKPTLPWIQTSPSPICSAFPQEFPVLHPGYLGCELLGSSHMKNTFLIYLKWAHLQADHWRPPAQSCLLDLPWAHKFCPPVSPVWLSSVKKSWSWPTSLRQSKALRAQQNLGTLMLRTPVWRGAMMLSWLLEGKWWMRVVTTTSTNSKPLILSCFVFPTWWFSVLFLSTGVLPQPSPISVTGPPCPKWWLMSSSLFCTGGTGAWAEDFVLIKQVLYHLSTP